MLRGKLLKRCLSAGAAARVPLLAAERQSLPKQTKTSLLGRRESGDLVATSSHRFRLAHLPWPRLYLAMHNGMWVSLGPAVIHHYSNGTRVRHVQVSDTSIQYGFSLYALVLIQ